MTPFMEFINVYNNSCGTGDVNEDDFVNVLDIVTLVNCILSSSCVNCAGDMNGDGTYNVIDLVSLVSLILSGGN